MGLVFQANPPVTTLHQPQNEAQGGNPSQPSRITPTPTAQTPIVGINTPLATPCAGTNTQLQLDLATEVRKGIALGFQAFSNAGLFAQGAGARRIQVTTEEKNKIYSPDAIAALKGYSNTYDIQQLQPIWATFQTTKNVNVHHRHLQFGMEKRAKAHGVDLDRGMQSN